MHHKNIYYLALYRKSFNICPKQGVDSCHPFGIWLSLSELERSLSNKFNLSVKITLLPEQHRIPILESELTSDSKAVLGESDLKSEIQ